MREYTAECVGGPEHGKVICQPFSTFTVYKRFPDGWPHPDCKAAHVELVPILRGQYQFVAGYIADRAIWRWMGWVSQPKGEQYETD